MCIGKAETELICDFAETYHIYDYQALPCGYAAALASGLGIDSRVRRKLSGAKTDQQTYLLACIADRLSYLVWFQTKDGQKGRNRPHLFTDDLTGKTAEREKSKPMAFDTPEQLDRALARFKR